MHQCLRIPDIIKLICDQVHDNNQSKDGYYDHVTRNSQLLAIALTCSDFREPALAKLWETIYHLSPIIKCVGQDLWRLRFQKALGQGCLRIPERTSLDLSRRISPLDVIIMKKYAALIRHIEKCEARRHCHDVAFDSDVWKKLQPHLEGTILFSNLRSIYCDFHALEIPTTLLGAQNLTSFVAPFDAMRSPSKLFEFFTRCSGVRSVDLGGDLAKNTEVYAALSNWPQLTQVVASYGAPDFIQALSCSSGSLRHLKIRHLRTLVVATPWRVPPTAQDSPIFLTLEKLEVGFYRFLDILEFVNYITATDNLRSLSLNYWNAQPYEESDWLNLLQFFQKHSRFLEEINLVESYYSSVPEWTFLLSNVVFSALGANFPTLTRIKIYNLQGYDIVDNDMKNLTEALPLLEELRLYSRKPVTGLSIVSLVSFARNCPSLSFLALMFDARLGPHGSPQLTLEPPASGRSRGIKLKRLHVFASPIDDPLLVSEFIKNTFPKLEYIGWDNYIGGEYLLQWSKVCNLLLLNKWKIEPPSTY